MPGPSAPPPKKTVPKATNGGGFGGPAPAKKDPLAGRLGGKPKPIGTAPAQVKSLSNMKIKGQQEFLKNKGYNISVDGVEGPETRLARKAFLNNVPSSYWNKVRMSKTTPVSKPADQAAGTTTVNTPPKKTPPTKTPPTKTPPKKTPPGKTPPKSKPVVIRTQEDWKKAADAAAAAQYDPTIHEYDRQAQQLADQSKQAVSSLDAWQKQIADNFNQYAGFTQKQFGDQIAGTQKDYAGIGQLFGGDQAAEAAYMGQPNIDFLRMMGAGDAAFSNNMQGVMQAQGQDYRRRAQGDFLQLVQDLNAKKAEAVAQKSQASVANRYQYQQDAIKTRQAQEALDQAKALNPLEVQAAKLRNQQTAAQIAREKRNAPYDSEYNRLKLKQTQLEIDAAVKAAKDKSPNGTVNLKDPQVVSNLVGSIKSSFTGPKGGLVIRPDVAMQNALTSVGQIPGLNKAQASRLVMAEIAKALRISHAKGEWVAYSIKNGKVVFDPKKARPTPKSE